MAAGRLVALEGAEGVGKTTQLRLLADHLAAHGRLAAVLREPGGTPLGDEIRRLLLDPARQVEPAAEALLFMASRAQLLAEEVRPRLARGEAVLLDRFFLSTYAYQIAGRGLPEPQVTAANALATGGLTPDLTIVLVLGAAEARRRAERRGAPDRMERAGDRFHDRVERAFATFLTPSWQGAHAEAGPIVAVDAAGEPDAVRDRLLAELHHRFPETFPPARGS